MCYDRNKGEKAIILDKDIYVLKEALYGGATTKTFISSIHRFEYEAGKIYKKGWWKIILASWRRELTGEVFHSYAIPNSIWRVKDWKSYTTDASSPRENPDFGIFRIPKGTRIYSDGYEIDHKIGYVIASFAIEYIGPLSTSNSQLILDQDEQKATISEDNKVQGETL